MLELLDTLPDINVSPAEYKRLLGFPREHILAGRARDLAEQPRLLALIKDRRSGLPFALDCLDSGMLRPKKSQLAVFGLTAHTEKVRRLTDLIPCESCTFASCEFRRAPFLRNNAFLKQ